MVQKAKEVADCGTWIGVGHESNSCYNATVGSFIDIHRLAQVCLTKGEKAADVWAQVRLEIRDRV